MDQTKAETEEAFKDVESVVPKLEGNEMHSKLKDTQDVTKDEQIVKGDNSGGAVKEDNNKVNSKEDGIVAMETDRPSLLTNDNADLGDGDSDDCFKDEIDTGTVELKSSQHMSSKSDLDTSQMVLKTETMTGGYVFKCLICLKCYKCQKSADHHMKIKHRGSSLCCEVCGKDFKLKYDLDRHLNVHKGIRPFPCPECDKSFVCKSSQMRHRKLHHLVGDIYKCHNCDKSFRAESDLKRHLFTHTGERPWSCDQCSKSFVSKSSLKVHVKIHDDSQKFSCSVCKKMFHIKTDLTRHESTHTGDLRWECAVCQKKYSGRSAVKRHVKDAHLFGKMKVCKDKMTTKDLLDLISERSDVYKSFEAFAKYKEDNSVDNLLKAVDSFVIYKGEKDEAQTN